MKYVYILQQALIWILLIYWIYQLTISFCALIKVKEKPMIINKKHKFMAIIPAHNEENVVGNLVRSLKEVDYPKEFYDIYVIADNCTDKTAEIAKKEGAIVYERFDEKHKTKGFALNWFLDKKIKENADYDAFCVFDADNIVDKNFFNAMNKKLCQGEIIVQGYKDIKNPTDSWISSGYALFYWTQHKFYQLARYNAGLSPLMNGTGFMVKFDLIKDTGWNTKTLTEDIEFSLINISKGNKLGWAVDAIVYDEQPTTFGQSWTQRLRWTAGHIQCFKFYTKDLAKGVFKNKTLTSFDGLIYIMCIPLFIISLLLMIVNLTLYLMSQMTFGRMTMHFFVYLILSYFLLVITALVTLIVEKRSVKKMIKGIITYPFFMASWLLINFVSLFKRDVKWSKIEHSQKIKAN